MARYFKDYLFIQLICWWIFNLLLCHMVIMNSVFNRWVGWGRVGERSKRDIFIVWFIHCLQQRLIQFWKAITPRLKKESFPVVQSRSIQSLVTPWTTAWDYRNVIVLSHVTCVYILFVICWIISLKSLFLYHCNEDQKLSFLLHMVLLISKAKTLQNNCDL